MLYLLYLLYFVYIISLLHQRMNTKVKNTWKPRKWYNCRPNWQLNGRQARACAMSMWNSTSFGQCIRKKKKISH